MAPEIHLSEGQQGDCVFLFRVLSMIANKVVLVVVWTRVQDKSSVEALCVPFHNEGIP